MKKLKYIFLIVFSLIISGCTLFNSGNSNNQTTTNKYIDFNERILINTSAGDIVITLFDDADTTAKQKFNSLIVNKYYENLKFHKVIIDFYVEIGDPVTKGIHNQDFVYENEANPNNLPVAGALETSVKSYDNKKMSFDHPGVAALNNNQLIITLAASPWLDQKYQIIGEVTNGFENLQKIELGDWINSIYHLSQVLTDENN